MEIKFHEQRGGEHADVHIDGFVLDSLFFHHAHRDSTSGLETHHLTQRKLSFNTNEHLLQRNMAVVTNSTELFTNTSQEFAALDASATLSRDKVRGLMKLMWTGVNQDWDYTHWSLKSLQPGIKNGDLPFAKGETTDAAGTKSYDELVKFWNMTTNELKAFEASNNATSRYFDVPSGEVARKEIGVCSLLFKKGNDWILLFRDTESPGDFINIESWITSAIVDNDRGVSKWLKKNWERAGLTWTAEMEKKRTANDLMERVALQTALYGKKYSGDFAKDLAAKANGAKIGGNGTAITLTEAEARKQGYWPITKQMIEEIRKQKAESSDPSSVRILFSGYSQGGGRAQLARMYTEKKHNEKYPVVTFAGVSPSCFPRNLDGAGRTDYLDDVDPTKFYENVHDYNSFFDVFGAALGGDSIGTTCFLENPATVEETPGYKYCKDVIPYSGPALFYADAMKKEPLRTDYSFCRYSTHSTIALLNLLGDDSALLSNGLTNTCFKYEPLTNAQCPAQSMFVAGLAFSAFVGILAGGLFFVLIVFYCMFCRKRGKDTTAPA